MSFAEIFNSGFWEGMEQLSDGALQTDDGTTFRIHKVVLSPRSRYFRALFTFDLKQETVVIPNIDRKTLESVLIYMYTSKLKLDEENACDMMIASDYLLLDELLKSCEAFVIQNMTVTNCMTFLTLASQINRLALFENSYRYATVHFEHILETPNSGLKELPFEILAKLLGSKSLNVVSEISVWRAIVSWTEADSSTRLPQVPILLTYLRLEEEDSLGVDILSHTIVSSNPHVLNNHADFYTMKRAILSQCASLEPRYQNLPCSDAPRVPNRLHLISRNIRGGSELFLTYDNNLDYWRQIGATDRHHDKMLRIGQHINMLFEGQIRHYIFDIVEESLLKRNFPPVPTSLNFFWEITITLGEQLYCIDRRQRMMDDISSTILRYEFDGNRWESITNTLDIKIDGAVALKDQIFIVGVSNFNQMMCRAYDPEKDSWIQLLAPNIFRRHFYVEAFHEQVFVIPGPMVVRVEEHPKIVEVYDPLQNTWRSLPDLPFEYEYSKVVIADDKIIVCEDNGDERRRLMGFEPPLEWKPPVYWDEGADLWRIIDESSPWYHIERYSFLVMDDSRLVKDVTAQNRRPENAWERILPV
ncbi:Kelch-like protein 20 [Araneus ventricosus]|uniref:Kelch-like protein 20 n=1 Tax=Araneus ventricosus TaxID=182803 RepID=A0A4Y2X955_ARAVE|nr:Kelch-like protein 20 [Araneus ventricosus]